MQCISRFFFQLDAAGGTKISAFDSPDLKSNVGLSLFDENDTAGIQLGDLRKSDICSAGSLDRSNSAKCMGYCTRMHKRKGLLSICLAQILAPSLCARSSSRLLAHKGVAL